MGVKLLTDRLSVNRVLNSNIVCADGINVIPLGKFDGDMVKDSIGHIEEVDAAMTGVCVDSPLPKTDIAADDIV